MCPLLSIPLLVLLPSPQGAKARIAIPHLLWQMPSGLVPTAPTLTHFHGFPRSHFFLLSSPIPLLSPTVCKVLAGKTIHVGSSEEGLRMCLFCVYSTLGTSEDKLLFIEYGEIWWRILLLRPIVLNAPKFFCPENKRSESSSCHPITQKCDSERLLLLPFLSPLSFLLLVYYCKPGAMI
jgi:hypothetical protein